MTSPNDHTPTAEKAQTPPLTGFSVSESPLCHHCGHVRGLHGRNHGCISAFADGEAGKPCACPGFVRYPPTGGES